MLENAANPTCRLHALLGAFELEDSLTEKDTATNRIKFWHTTYSLAIDKKHDLPKRQITESQLW